MNFLIGKQQPEPTINTWLDDRKNGFAIMMRAPGGQVQTVAEISVGDCGLRIAARRIHNIELCAALGVGVGELSVPINAGISYEAPQVPTAPPARPNQAQIPAAPGLPPQAPVASFDSPRPGVPLAKRPVEPWNGVDTSGEAE